MREINIETYLKKKKIKRENMRKTRYHNVSEKREKTKTKGMSKNLS